MNQPSVSIIVPIYNVEEYIEECLESIVSQVNHCPDIEVILVNDATQDNSMFIVDRYKKNYGFIKIIELSNNQGLSIARNIGIRESKGIWLWFVDSDDWLEPNAIQIVLTELREHIDNDIICIQKRDYLKNKDCIIDENNTLFSSVQMDGKQYLKSGLQKSVAQKFIVKRQFLIDHHVEFYPHIFHEDDLYVCTLLYYTKKIFVLNKYLYGKRQERPYSIMSSIGQKNAQDMIIVHKQLMLFWDSCVEAYDKEWYFILCFRLLKKAYEMIDTYYGTHSYTAFQAKNKAYKNDICKMSLKYGGVKNRLYSLLFYLSPHYSEKISRMRSRIRRTCGL